MTPIVTFTSGLPKCFVSPLFSWRDDHTKLESNGETRRVVVSGEEGNAERSGNRICPAPGVSVIRAEMSLLAPSWLLPRCAEVLWRSGQERGSRPGSKDASGRHSGRLPCAALATSISGKIRPPWGFRGVSGAPGDHRGHPSAASELRGGLCEARGAGSPGNPSTGTS